MGELSQSVSTCTNNRSDAHVRALQAQVQAQIDILTEKDQQILELRREVEVGHRAHAELVIKNRDMLDLVDQLSTANACSEELTAKTEAHVRQVAHLHGQELGSQSDSELERLMETLRCSMERVMSEKINRRCQEAEAQARRELEARLAAAEARTQIAEADKRDAEERLRVFAQERECVVCLDAEREVMLLPCRHMCVCTPCADQLQHTKMTCPVCSNSISASEKVFCS